MKSVGILTCVMALTMASSSLADQSTGASTGSAITVHMRDSSFQPTATKVAVGQTVAFVNDDEVLHNVTGGDKSLHSGDIAGGKTWKFTFDKAGTYRYTCTYHPWMTGEVDVSDAGK